MHIATLTHPITWGGQSLSPGRYALEDHNAAELLHAGRGDGAVTLTCGEYAKPDPFRWQEVAEILVVRVGGFGDLLWCNAIYDELHRQRPDLKIIHACFPRYASVLHGHADEVISYPLPISLSPSLSLPPSTYWLENIIESTPCLNGEHPTDRIARRFGLDPDSLPRKAAYTLPDRERRQAEKRWPRTGEPRLCLQVESSTGNKGYPNFDELLALLQATGIQIVIVGDPSPRDGLGPANVFNCRPRGFSIRESIAMAATCDLIIGADSVFLHVGAALDIPVLGLFGPFHGDSYLKGQRGLALQGRLPCSPCSWHPRGLPFPPNQPCSTQPFHCKALAAIPAREVAARAMEMVGRGDLENDQGQTASK